ncbi:glycosyltransferase family 1 protein [Algoriphagus terrigena]|uniref:glycosyltransferase family 1 protein n=1 Tax=Algoriphagus terrigena TaxID=344884 RepID=UPI0003FD9704|nr:glycosyltransferase family 1 protein [Algoriphagus terrigena]
MKFLIIEQDLRVSGTSQGIISRSFLAKLRKAYPESLIDVHYIKAEDSMDKLELLPVNNIIEHRVDIKLPMVIKLMNKLYWRIFSVSLGEKWIVKQYSRVISRIEYKDYDHIFIRSAGVAHETILATLDLPVLKDAIVNFHDPFPVAWYVGSRLEPTKLDFFRLAKMMKIVERAKVCTSTASYMSHDLQHLYKSKKPFLTLPHQFDPAVFDLTDSSLVRKKEKRISISYHGALMFGRNIENLIKAYNDILASDDTYVENTELILRVKGNEVARIVEIYKDAPNIKFLTTINFSNSSNEQIYQSDIVIILENGPYYCNILVGKAPFLASSNKAVLCLSPKKSELRNIISDKRCIANMEDREEIKEKLKELIDNELYQQSPVKAFGDYFNLENFQIQLDNILNFRPN